MAKYPILKTAEGGNLKLGSISNLFQNIKLPLIAKFHASITICRILSKKDLTAPTINDVAFNFIHVAWGRVIHYLTVSECQELFFFFYRAADGVLLGKFGRKLHRSLKIHV